ncbi:MAG: hypothetical protein JW814_03570 [Candidatus Krumholzibacteriota bacterium]|nr:hypothetical protein [Candidatus Krumholzibacteriota bacterium]
MKLGLENITALLDSFGNPQEKFPSILIAGTNGKGSVTTYVTSILRRAGYRTGTFYSPHLFRVNERIRINGEEIASRALDDIVGSLRERYQRYPFTFFEGITAAAILYFLREKVDIAVFEVGLGGRLDATRLVNALVTVITGISRDHEEHLGRTNSAILEEKLGITRQGSPLVANLGDKSLIRMAGKFCLSRGIEFIDAGKGISRRMTRIRADSVDFNLVTPVRDYGIIRSRMTGRVQMENVVTAIRTAEVLSGKMKGIGKKAIISGTGEAFFSARFQVLSGNPRVVLDVSHNEEALDSTLETLARISPPEKNVLIFGVMARKQLGDFPIRALVSAREIILVPLKGTGSATGEDLLRRFTGAVEINDSTSSMKGRCVAGREGGSSEKKTGKDRAEVTLARGMTDAVRRAGKILSHDDTLLICGSHLCVEEAVGPVGRFIL